MKTNQAQSARINALAIAAHRSLDGSQIEFAQLYEELNARKKSHVSAMTAKYPSLQTDDLEALFDDMFFAEIRKYPANHAKGLDFMQCLNQALTLRTFSMLPKAIARRQATESLEQRIEATGDDGLPMTAQVDAVLDETSEHFDSQEAEDAWLNERLDTFGIEGAAARTVAIQRYRHDVSYREIVSIAPQLFRNAQQAHRAVAGKAHRGIEI